MPTLLKNKRFLLIGFSSVLVVLLLLWLGVAAYIVNQAPKLTFDTAKSKNIDYGVDYTTVFRNNSKGEKIEIITVPQKPNVSNQKIVLYLHGNVGRLPYIMKDATDYGIVVSPAYPGYSGSEGIPTSENVYETLDITMKYLFDLGFYEDQITVLGHSMGASPAVYAAQKYPKLNKVIAVNTFYSMQKMCETKYSIFCVLGGNFLNTAKIAPEAKARINFFCNPNDNYVPTKQCRDLYEKIGSKDKKLFDISGTHETFPVEEAFRNQ